MLESVYFNGCFIRISYRFFYISSRIAIMTKTLKNDRKSIQSRERNRRHRSIKSILRRDEAFLSSETERREQSPDRILNNEKTIAPTNLSNSLQSWGNDFHIKKTALTSLLKILKSAGIQSLPSDSRTLLNTPRRVQIDNCANGKYWHNGLQNCLAQVFARLTSNLCVDINVNIDGLPLFKGSPISFWPILINFHGMFP